MCPFDVMFSANDSVLRAEHDPLLRTAYFLSKTRVLRVRKERSTVKIVPIGYILPVHIRDRTTAEKHPKKTQSPPRRRILSLSVVPEPRHQAKRSEATYIEKCIH